MVADLIRYCTTTTISNISRFDKMSEITENGELKYAQWYYGPQQRLLSSLKLNLCNKKIYDNASLILSFQNIKESRNSRRFNSLNLKSQSEDLNIFSIMIQAHYFQIHQTQ